MDTGDALAGGDRLGDLTDGQVIIDGMNLMGYDAMALGPLDLALGPAALSARMAEAQFALLSANVLDKATGQPAAPPYVVLSVGDHPVAIVGLTRLPQQPLAGYDVLDPAQAAAEAVAQAAQQADTVILLTNIEYRAALALVESLDGVDLVVSALPAQLPQAAAWSASGALVVVADQPMTRHTGRRVGRLVVTIKSDGSLSANQWESIPMDNAVADDPAMKALLERYPMP